LEGVFAGTYTDAGIELHLPGDDALPDDAKEVIAHELFHYWLGGLLVNDGSSTWFYEGFTVYIALLNSVALGLTSPSRFAERILQFERSVQSAGSDSQPRFAAANVNWRAGKNETIAYRKGALLAFLVDVRLRQRGKGTVFEIIRTLLHARSATYRLSHLHDAMTTLGVADVYDHFIVGNDQLPEARFLLTTIGYDEVREPAGLTYLGIEAQSLAPPNSDDVVPALVIEVDPGGPSAKAGIKAGDTIISYGSRRSNPPQLGAGAPARYRFGLNLIPSGAKSVFFEIRRDGKPMRLEVTPVLVPGGHRTVLRWNAVRATKFFDLNITER
jgi:predicted metalloprotease with PDZ domain